VFGASEEIWKSWDQNRFVVDRTRFTVGVLAGNIFAGSAKAIGKAFGEFRRVPSAFT
jgi:hypothetical protein